jgi:hypothetical protein
MRNQNQFAQIIRYLSLQEYYLLLMDVIIKQYVGLSVSEKLFSIFHCIVNQENRTSHVIIFSPTTRTNPLLANFHNRSGTTTTVKILLVIFRLMED